MAKIVGTKAYAHRDYVDTLPNWAAGIVEFFDGHANILSLPEEAWNVIRVEKAYTNKSGNLVPESVALLAYHNFDEADHPELLASVKLWPKSVAGVYIIETKNTVFAGRKSPPILHRKEALVDQRHPQYDAWKMLTRHEEQAGLLSQPGIGTKLAWERKLAEAGYTIMFGCLMRIVEVDDA